MSGASNETTKATAATAGKEKITIKPATTTKPASLLQTIKATVHDDAKTVYAALDTAYQFHTNLNETDEKTKENAFSTAAQTNPAAAVWLLKKSASLGMWYTKLDVNKVDRTNAHPLALLVSAPDDNEDKPADGERIHIEKIHCRREAITLLWAKLDKKSPQAGTALQSAITARNKFFIELALKDHGKSPIFIEEVLIDAAKLAMKVDNLPLAKQLVKASETSCPIQIGCLIQESYAKHKDALVEIIKSYPADELKETSLVGTPLTGYFTVSFFYYIARAYGENRWDEEATISFICALGARGITPQLYDGVPAAIWKGLEGLKFWENNVRPLSVSMGYNIQHSYCISPSSTTAEDSYCAPRKLLIGLSLPMLMVLNRHSLDEKAIAYMHSHDLKKVYEFVPAADLKNYARSTDLYSFTFKGMRVVDATGKTYTVIRYNLLDVAIGCGDLVTVKTLLQTNFSTHHSLDPAIIQYFRENFRYVPARRSENVTELAKRAANLVSAYNLACGYEIVSLTQLLPQLPQDDKNFLSETFSTDAAKKKIWQNALRNLASPEGVELMVGDSKTHDLRPLSAGSLFKKKSDPQILAQILALAAQLQDPLAKQSITAIIEHFQNPAPTTEPQSAATAAAAAPAATASAKK